eukprot:3824876-Amphidinium_carterae.2
MAAIQGSLGRGWKIRCVMWAASTSRHAAFKRRRPKTVAFALLNFSTVAHLYRIGIAACFIQFKHLGR